MVKNIFTFLDKILFYGLCLEIATNGLQLPEGREFENEISLKE